MILLATACLVPYPEEEEVQYDALGLPDCDASYNDLQLCQSLTGWASTEAAGFNAGPTSGDPVRWVGTEVQPAFCSDDAAEAEAWVLEHDPDGEGSHEADLSDPRWWDFLRTGADATLLRRDRVFRCDFATDASALPPGEDSVADLLHLTSAMEASAFFPVARELARWRRVDDLTVQVILNWGEVEVESAQLRVCAVRCGDCDDQIGPTRNTTAILESQDWIATPDDGVVRFDVTAVREVACQLKF